MCLISQVTKMNTICCFVCNFSTTLRLFPIKTNFLLPFFCICRINHNKVHQSFKEFASPIKNLVWGSLNHTKRNKAHNMRKH